jgi:acetyl esterase/lipase
VSKTRRGPAPIACLALGFLAACSGPAPTAGPADAPDAGTAADAAASDSGATTKIKIRASSATYESSASFLSKADGTIDLATDAPISGSYSGVDADGLFWSMTAADPNDRVDYPVAFSAEDGEQILITQTLARFLAPDGATKLRVEERGLVGVFVAPPTPGPHPALIAFGGSEGGLFTGQVEAQYYASLGYACLGLAYFGAPGLPANLEEIPLEYFGTAIDWLKGRPEVDPARIGVKGASRGGELALLLGATFPELKAVVAMVPSGLVWGGISSTSTTDIAAWTYGGRDLPFMPSSGSGPTAVVDAAGRTAYEERPAFLADIAGAPPAAREAATIPVERTQGAVLMIGGADDQLWPSCPLAQIALDRLSAAGHTAAHGDRLVCYPGAGHFISTPNLPTVGADEYYLSDLDAWLMLGGTPQAIAHAARESDQEIRAFLARAL